MAKRGKYQDIAERIQKEFSAEGVVIIVRGGTKGTGMSVTGTLAFQAEAPNLLELSGKLMRENFDSALKDALEESNDKNPNKS